MKHKAVKAATGAAAVLAFLVPPTAARAGTDPVAGLAGTVTGVLSGAQQAGSKSVSAVPGLADTESNLAGDVSTAASSILPAPAGDDFYTPPSPLPPGQPGDIIWYREVTPPASAIPASTVYQVLYRSVGVSGKAIAVSGDVFVPKAKWTGQGTRPLVAYASGTQGWGPQCAPSREISSGDFDEQFAVSGLLAKGFAVAVTDEPGEGTPGPQLYTVGIAEGHAVLDSLRAAIGLPGAGLPASTPTAIEGYSQGGGAAGWAAQLHHSYAPGINLKGVALGGTPANLQAVSNNINGTAFFGFLGGAAIGFGAAYPSLDLQSELNDAGKRAFASLQTMCQEQGLVTYAFQRIENYTKTGTNPMSAPAWTAVLDANDLGAVAPDVPVMQVHGLADEVIPYSVEATLHDQWCELGVKSDLVSFPTEHVTTGIDDQVAVVP
ncbi:MAG: hypothetical protein J2P26_12645, partial [Nocardiopsaceae bacterium]|nr:hypothetical protein [Nocardiopsaceae bacterium]